MKTYDDDFVLVTIAVRCGHIDASKTLTITWQVRTVWYTHDNFKNACAPEDEGITWCHGWHGPEVDAFKAQLALGRP